MIRRDFLATSLVGSLGLFLGSKAEAAPDGGVHVRVVDRSALPAGLQQVAFEDLAVFPTSLVVGIPSLYEALRPQRFVAIQKGDLFTIDEAGDVLCVADGEVYADASGIPHVMSRVLLHRSHGKTKTMYFGLLLTE